MFSSFFIFINSIFLVGFISNFTKINLFFKIFLFENFKKKIKIKTKIQ